MRKVEKKKKQEQLLEGVSRDDHSQRQGRWQDHCRQPNSSSKPQAFSLKLISRAWQAPYFRSLVTIPDVFVCLCLQISEFLFAHIQTTTKSTKQPRQIFNSNVHTI